MSSITGNVDSTNVVAIIPARSGSKRVASKNIRNFAGKPLLAYSIAAAKASEIFSRIIVSTDSEEIAAIARAHGAETPFLRPPELADDFCPMADVVRHAVNFVEQQGKAVDFSCCIFATAPMVSAEDIRRGYEALRTDTSFRSALAVTEFEFPIQRALRLNDAQGLEMLHPEHRLTRSQDLEPCYHDAAQFVWTNNHYDESQPGKGIKPVFIDRRRVQDIDTPEDWERAEHQYRVFSAMQEEGMQREVMQQEGAANEFF